MGSVFTWPPQMKTSPKSTPWRVARSPALELKLSVYAAIEAGMGGSDWRHVPSVPAMVVNVAAEAPASAPRLMVVCTVALGAIDRPHTMALCGA